MRDLELISNKGKLEFANTLISALAPRAFGSLSKSELDASIYEALRSAGYIRNDLRVFDVAERLQILPSRVNTLRYGSRLRAGDRRQQMIELASAVSVVISETGGEIIVLNVEDRFWRDALTADLKAASVYVDFSFNRERLVLKDARGFDEIVKLFGDESKQFRASMRKARAAANAKTNADLVRESAQELAKSGAAHLATAGLVSLRMLLMPHLGV